MDRIEIFHEDTRVTVMVVLALWLGAVLAGSGAGVFAKLATEEVLALAAFATAFALATYRLDAEVRRFVLAHWATLPAALVLDAVVGLDAIVAWRAAPASDLLGTLPHSAALLFALPLAAMTTAAAIERRRTRKKVRSAQPKSPGATPAAT